MTFEYIQYLEDTMGNCFLMVTHNKIHGIIIMYIPREHWLIL